MIKGGEKEITLRGELVRLLPEGLLHWPAPGVLAVADLHLGKAETFGSHGYPLPGLAQADDLALLSAVTRRLQVRTVIFLGDLVHSLSGISPELVDRFSAFLTELGCEAVLTAGNHDRGLVKRWPAAWRNVQVLEQWRCGQFLFRHEPAPQTRLEPASQARRGSDKTPFVWTGHLHPCVRLRRGPDLLRMKVFVIRKDSGILPAFSRLAGGFEVEPEAGVELYGVGGVALHKLA